MTRRTALTAIVSSTVLSLMLNATLAAVTTVQDWSAPNTYGTKDDTVLTIGAYKFISFDPFTPHESDGVGYRYLTSPGGWFATVELPSGALLKSIGVSACDNKLAADVNVGLYSATKGAVSEINHGGVSSANGCAITAQPLPPIVIDNNSRVYYVVVTMGTDIDTRFNAVTLSYRLQVSPPPAAATFADVPVGHSQRPFIEALVAAGITGGCGGGNYCPDAPLTRGQMAVFLAVALGLHWPL